LLFKEIAEYFHPSDTKPNERIARGLARFKVFKDELLVARAHYKVPYIPPGTAFDPEIMDALSPSGYMKDPKKFDQPEAYRVQICLW
jgi:hypothetical protein